jgi:hypothetical protein
LTFAAGDFAERDIGIGTARRTRPEPIRRFAVVEGGSTWSHPRRVFNESSPAGLSTQRSNAARSI